MQFNPDDDIQLERKVLQEGIGNFEIKDAYEGVSQSSGNPQIILSIILTDERGDKTILNDYLPSDKKMIWKIRAVLTSIGKGKLFNTGNVEAQDFVDGKGSCVIKNIMNPKYGEQSSICKYEAAPDMTSSEMLARGSKTQKVTSVNFDDEDVPF